MLRRTWKVACGISLSLCALNTAMLLRSRWTTDYITWSTPAGGILQRLGSVKSNSSAHILLSGPPFAGKIL
jgi:hypothetical protein